MTNENWEVRFDEKFPYKWLLNEGIDKEEVKSFISNILYSERAKICDEISKESRIRGCSCELEECINYIKNRK